MKNKIVALIVVLAALAACTSQRPTGAAPTDTAAPDPITQGHSVWCGTNPPSGYCIYD
jgi:hypothetical protein